MSIVPPRRIPLNQHKRALCGLVKQVVRLVQLCTEPIYSGTEYSWELWPSRSDFCQGLTDSELGYVETVGQKPSGRRKASRVGDPSPPERPAGLELSRCRNPADWIVPGWRVGAPPEVGLPNEKLRATAHRVLAYRNIKQNNRSHPVKFITLILLLPTILNKSLNLFN